MKSPNSTIKARRDLMTLGIELDDDLIERLQNNLGVETIFSVAEKAAEIIKEKKKNQSDRSKTDPKEFERDIVKYRSKSFSNDVVDKDAMQKVVKPWNGGKANISNLLIDLQERSSLLIEPQHRPSLDKLIEKLSILYHRSPHRFVSILLNKKISTTDKGDDGIHRIILKSRYVNEETFKIMLSRVLEKVPNDIIHSLFKLLCEDMTFGNLSHEVVDLWAFVTLMKTASEQKRRSFDSKRSQVANDVEFWNTTSTSMSNDVIIMHPSPKSPNPMKNSNKKISDMSHQTSKSSSEIDTKIYINTKNYQTSVAQLLGHKNYIHPSQVGQGRNVIGTLRAQVVNTGDKAESLNSLSKMMSSSSSTPRSPKLRRSDRIDVYGRPDLHEPIHANIFGPSKVRNLLSPPDQVDVINKEYNFKQTRNTLKNESYNKTSMADALGNSMINNSATPSPLGSLLIKESYNKTSMVDALSYNSPAVQNNGKSKETTTPTNKSLVEYLSQSDHGHGVRKQSSKPLFAYCKSNPST